MKKKIQEYLHSIKHEIQEKTQVFNFDQEQFEKFTTFDYVDFYLIYSYIFEDKKKEDFFLSIPEDDDRENFYTSIFHSVVLIKLYQNYFNSKKAKTQLGKGDLIYIKYRGDFRVCEIKSNINNTRINLKFPKKNEKNTQDFYLEKEKPYTKINPSVMSTMICRK